MANIQINIVENGTTTLATSGCICDRNIDINVDVPTNSGEVVECNKNHLPDSALAISGNCNYKFAHNGWAWFIQEYGDQITTDRITDATSMFESNNALTAIPFDLNFSPSNYCSCTKMFYAANNIREFPVFRNLYAANMEQMFRRCYNMRNHPIFENFNYSRINSYAYVNLGYLFANCYSLRTIDENFLKNMIANPYNSGNAIYNYFLEECVSLDEVRGMPKILSNQTGNMFNSTFANSSRLKNIIFDTNEDGTPYTQNWHSQTIDLTKNVGYVTSANKSKITTYNSGITEDKEVTDDASYQALKNDPDWFTTNVEYSRFNHDSAVNLINSLPDTSAFLVETGNKYKNQIKFVGNSGSKTDGGSISSLTSAEVKVANDKGWTIYVDGVEFGGAKDSDYGLPS